MKLNQIALAVAAMAAAPAFALTPGQVGGATSLWITGASAPTNSVFLGAMTLCQGMKYKDAAGVERTNPGSIDAHFYLEGTSGVEPGKSGAGDRIAYACTVRTFDGRAGVLENTKLVLYHTVEGGSFNAYTPALALAGDTNANIPATLRRIEEVADLGGTGKCAAGVATDTTVSVSGVNNVIPRYNGCSLTVVTLATGAKDRATDAGPVTSIGGYSDTEFLINKLNLGVATDLSSIGSEVNTNIGQGFGVAVSYPLYAQLQKNDGLINTVANDGEPCDGNYTSPACQPGLPAQVYSTVAWRDAAGSIDASLFGGAVSGKVNLARRAITSGTQSASNLRFLNTPCATGDAAGALAPTRAGSYNGGKFVVTEQSGTSGVKTVLNTATGAGEFGLGIMSLENTPAPTATADRWAFVKLNGITPNLAAGDTFQRAEAIKGNYDFWYELMAFTAATAPQAGIDLLASINASLANPELTNLKGLFLTPLAGVTGSNVSKGTRFGNSCQVIGQ
ncbi:MAG: hypothetical protein AB1720_13100 [Pseudomonadota bacterium]